MLTRLQLSGKKNNLRPFKNIPWNGKTFFPAISIILFSVTSQKVCFTKGCLPDQKSLNCIKPCLWSGVKLAHQTYSFISHKSKKYLGSLTKIQYLHCCCTQSYFQNSLKNSVSVTSYQTVFSYIFSDYIGFFFLEIPIIPCNIWKFN